MCSGMHYARESNPNRQAAYIGIRRGASGACSGAALARALWPYSLEVVESTWPGTAPDGQEAETFGVGGEVLLCRWLTQIRDSEPQVSQRLGLTYSKIGNLAGLTRNLVREAEHWT